MPNLIKAAMPGPDFFHLTISNETVRKTVRQLDYRRKKKSLHASEQERPRCGREEEKLEWPYIWIQGK